MNNIGIHDCRMIRSPLPDEDLEYLSPADLILLAGGSVERGWHDPVHQFVREEDGALSHNLLGPEPSSQSMVAAVESC